MTDKPILLSGPMVRALLSGRKTQTRRVLKPQPDFRGGYGDYHDAEEWGWEDEDGYHVSVLDIAPNGFRVGDRLWVREAHALLPRSAYRTSVGTGTIQQAEHPTDGYTAAVFREGFDRSGAPPWRPSIYMPRWASRLTLTVTNVRVQRVQAITEYDAQAEGVRPAFSYPGWEGVSTTPCYRWGFHETWDNLNAKRGYGWDRNPWVVALTFDVHLMHIDRLDAAA